MKSLILILAALATAAAARAGPLAEAVDSVERENADLRARLAALQNERPVRELAATVGHAVHVAVPDLEQIAEAEHLDPLWDFGDGGPPRPGFNAAHAYAAPGVYDLTLDDRPFARVTVVADPRPATLVRDAAELAAAAARGGVVRLADGVTFDVAEPIVLTRPTTILGGQGSLVRAVRGTAGVFHLEDARGVSIRGVAFDSDLPRDGRKGGPKAVLVRSAEDVTLIDCTTGHLDDFVTVPNGCRLTRLLVQGCRSPDVGGLRSYFVALFGRSEDVALYDNLVANSTSEHCMRLSGEPGPTGGTFRVAVVGNRLSNLDRRAPEAGGVAWDVAKGTLVLRKGAWGYAADNDLTGPASAGPLGEGDGRGDAGARFRFAVWRGNRQAGLWKADHGLEHARFEANVVRGPALAGNETLFEVKAGGEAYGGRDVLDLTVRGNAWATPFAAGKVVRVWGSREVSLLDNRLVAGDRANPDHPAMPLLAFPDGLPRGFVSRGNRWALPPAGGWPGGGPFGALVGDQNQESSYLTPAAWRALPNTREDHFE